MKLVLASTSKYKSNVLKFAGLNHFVIESNFDEDSIEKTNVYDYVKQLSYGKALSVVDKVDDGIIIGLDTIVYVNGKILEKPDNLSEARGYIEMCSNNTASVITGLTLINKETNEIVNTNCESKVTLRKIDDDDIDYYIENEPNILYSSGFVIETIMSNFIDKIEGSFYNVLGIPVETIYKYIYDMGYKLKDIEK